MMMYELPEGTDEAGAIDPAHAGYFETISDPEARDAAVARYVTSQGLYGSSTPPTSLLTRALNGIARHVPPRYQDACFDAVDTLTSILPKGRARETPSLDDIDLPTDYIMVYGDAFTVPYGANVERSFSDSHKIISYKGTTMGIVSAPMGQEHAAMLTDALCRGGARNFTYIGNVGGLTDGLDSGDIIHATGDVGTRSPIPDIYGSTTSVSDELNDALLASATAQDITLKSATIYDTCSWVREETPDRLTQLVNEGYDAVEMELAAVSAVANSYGGGATGLMWVVDDHLAQPELKGERMSSGNVSKYTSGVRTATKLMRLAVESVHHRIGPQGDADRV